MICGWQLIAHWSANEVVHWMAVPRVRLGAPYRRFVDPDNSSKTDARIAFDLHKCEQNPHRFGGHLGQAAQ
jgi:hypothetical protein